MFKKKIKHRRQKRDGKNDKKESAQAKSKEEDVCTFCSARFLKIHPHMADRCWFNTKSSNLREK